ncbi:MAG: hypothetical protein WAZ27_04825 [Minisyncoccia bacterium]
MDTNHSPTRDIVSGPLAQASQATQTNPGQAIIESTVVQNEQISKLFDPNSSLGDFFNGLFYAALAAGAMLAVLRLGYAGFMYMTSDIWSSKQKATEMIQQAVTGLLLLLAVYLILFQINPDILNLEILRSINPST